MKYAQAQKDALALLVKHPKAVTNCICPDDKVGIIIDGVVGYVIPEDANWIDLERVERVLNLRNLVLPLMSAENKLEPTENLVDKGDTIVREFRKAYPPAAAPVYIQEKLLKNFEFPTFYQDAERTKGIIAITEMTQLEGEVLVGFVLPFNINRD